MGFHYCLHRYGRSGTERTLCTPSLSHRRPFGFYCLSLLGVLFFTDEDSYPPLLIVVYHTQSILLWYSDHTPLLPYRPGIPTHGTAPTSRCSSQPTLSRMHSLHGLLPHVELVYPSLGSSRSHQLDLHQPSCHNRSSMVGFGRIHHPLLPCRQRIHTMRNVSDGKEVNYCFP